MSETSILDSARDVRDGEDLDRDALYTYLRATLGRPNANIQLQQFPGGHSNLTYLIRIDHEDMVLRRPPFGSNVKTAHDMGREYRMLSHLAPHYERAPMPKLFCDDPSIIGSEFYVMKRVRGVILRKAIPQGLTLDAMTAQLLCETAAQTLAELHALDYVSIGLGDFGRPQGYVDRQVAGWTQRYYDAQTDVVLRVDDVATWLAEHKPHTSEAAIIHNDYKFDNLVLDAMEYTHIVGILDWEMTTIGDPLMDLGSALAYWVQPSDPEPLKRLSFGPTLVPGMITRREFADRYASASGRDLSHIVFYLAFGLFKTAVILQQIYARYQRGLTQDPRFASFGSAVQVLVGQAAATIDSDTL